MIKRFLWILLLASSLQMSWSFTPDGPVGNGGDNWQTAIIGYSGDVAPKNIGEEYRRNTPVMYYAYDANFLGFFGPEGAASVDGAFVILNALTNVDNYSPTLSDFPMESRHQNYQAQAMDLYDLKSWTLGLMMEQLGLADPVRYTWTLHDREHVGAVACPVGMEYLVVQRNFDIVSTPLNQLQYSPYVNDTLYSYQIVENCGSAQAVPFAVDPLADAYSPVASTAITFGDFYNGLTRDDVAGLRYLLSTNNVNWETPAADSLLIVTNTMAQELFPAFIGTNSGVLFNGTYYGTASYGALLSFSKTNNAAAVQAAFPGVQLTQVGNYFTNVIMTNIISYYTNEYREPIGTPPILVTKTVLTPTIVEYFQYTFDNIITNIYSPTTTIQTQTITVAPLTGAAIGSPSVTNVTTKTSTIKIPNGEFYILPTNSPCGLDIISTMQTFTNYFTNILTAASTNATGTSAGTGTNATGTNANYAYSQIQVVPSLSHVYVINPVLCDQTNPITGLYRGIGNMKFVRADYDSLLGQYWQPVTNDYTMVLITNSQSFVEHFRRVVTAPDFLFSAQDLPAGPANPPYASTAPLFDTANVLPGLAGPGTITPATTITFNKDGPVYFNSFGDVMDGSPYFNQTPGDLGQNIGGNGTNILGQFYSEYFVWASFDGTTNAPTIFPNGTSLENLQNQVLIQVAPAGPLPDGYSDVNYGVNAIQFTATGGSFAAPFTWAATGLPLGLTVDPNTGALAGVPMQSGTFDFTLTLTDANSRSVQWTYTITIQP